RTEATAFPLEAIWLCWHPPENYADGPESLGVQRTSAGGAPQVSPARKGWVPIQHAPERRRCGTPTRTPPPISIPSLGCQQSQTTPSRLDRGRESPAFLS